MFVDWVILFMIKRRKNKLIIISFILILFGICCFVYDWYRDYQKVKHDNEMVETFFEETSILENDSEQTEENKEETTKEETYVDNYIAVLEVPKINLKRGLVDPDSYRNNVFYNVQIIKHSSMPDKLNSNLILASHSGSGYNAFFKNIYKLKQGDFSYVYYNGYKYIYQVDKIYDEDKDGNIQIKREHDKNTLTFITCSYENKNKQIVIISYLKDKEQYSGRN